MIFDVQCAEITGEVLDKRDFTVGDTDPHSRQRNWHWQNVLLRLVKIKTLSYIKEFYLLFVYCIMSGLDTVFTKWLKSLLTTFIHCSLKNKPFILLSQGQFLFMKYSITNDWEMNIINQSYNKKISVIWTWDIFFCCSVGGRYHLI